MGFITEKDYNTFIDKDDFDIISNFSDADREMAEVAALEEMKGYLRGRYDVDVDFFDIVEYDSSATYNEDDHVILNDRIYIAQQQTTGNDPKADNGTNWKEGDNRNAHLVMLLIDMIIYHLMTSVSARNIPQHRRIRYDGDNAEQTGGAIGWLKKVQNGKINPDLTPISDGDETDINNPVRWDSQEKRTNDW